MNRQSVRIAFLQLIVVLLVLAPFLAAGAYVWHKHQWANSLLAEIEPRHARLQGLKAIQPELDRALKQTQANLNRHAYPMSLDATKAGNDAQQRVRAVFAESQLSIESVQVLDAKEVDGFQRIGIAMRVEGSLPNFHEAILKLNDQAPSILVDGFSMQNLGPPKPSSAQRLMGSFNFSVLRAKS